MEEELEAVSPSRSLSGLDLVEMISVVASLGGSIASVVFEQVAFASIPLSLSVTLNLINRRQQIESLTQQNQTAIAQLAKQSEEHTEIEESNAVEIRINRSQLENLSKGLNQVQQLGSTLNQRTQELYNYAQNQDCQQKQTKEIVLCLREIDNFTQAIRANPDSAESYCQRGLVYGRLREKPAAIDDFNQAIEIDPSCATAYHYRGLAIAETNKKEAVEDLRQAAKLYFRQGKVDAYREVRDLCEQIHNSNQSTEVEDVKDDESQEDLMLSNFLV